MSGDDRSSSAATASTPFAHLTFTPGARVRSKSVNASEGTRGDFQEDCLSCRVIGTSACVLGASMVFREVFREPRRPLMHRGAMGAFAGAFLALGAYRAVI
ncbi:unnamed product [Ostreococcus tauri]|uniref:Unnamed product n=1 Tax=Ostreococcus tauri TaxID=70448 RepID=Q00XS2_OSTTA|nr:unnamed product [Ostreococcus tauri]CAL57329.1 unnamed product [Ostreococcus tauri]|eukprot:XP_003082383.1 unnamed product [Ostreococcus tauri]